MIVVNPSTRQFNIPGADLVFGVTADSGAVTKEFQCPRYVGNNLDLAGCFIRMNYRNANGEIDSYLVENVTVDGDNIVFGWALTPKVTMYKGNISFVMCVTGPDTKVAWHTTLGRGQVLEGLEPETDMIEEGTVDVLAQLIAMVERQTAAVEKVGTDQIALVKSAAQTAQDDAMAQIEAKGASTLATIPEGYTAVQNAVRGAANAIRGKVSGEVIRVDDVSPMEHHPVVKVHGKNLFDTSKIQVMPESSQNAYVREVGTGYIIVTTRTGYTGNGFCTIKQTLREVCPSLEVGKTYTLTATTESTSVNIYLYIPQAVWLFGKPMIVTEEMLNSAVTFYGLSERDGMGTGDCIISNIQIEEGAVATEYTPYVDPTTVTVTRCGKNLFPIENLNLTQSSGKGVVENDVLTVTGYLLSYRLRAPSLVGKTITFSCESTRSGEKGGGLSIECRDADNVRTTSVYKQNELSPTVTLVVANGTADVMLFFYAAGSQTETGTAVYKNIQLEISDTASQYEPYNGETQIPAADGTVTGLKSVSPTMSLLTDTPGVTIECEYSRDTNKVIEDILNKLTALVGNN